MVRNLSQSVVFLATSYLIEESISLLRLETQIYWGLPWYYFPPVVLFFVRKDGKERFWRDCIDFSGRLLNRLIVVI
jgi:hypothetical protein